MPNLRIFVEDFVALLGARTDKWVQKIVSGRNKSENCAKIRKRSNQNPNAALKTKTGNN